MDKKSTKCFIATIKHDSRMLYLKKTTAPCSPPRHSEQWPVRAIMAEASEAVSEADLPEEGVLRVDGEPRHAQHPHIIKIMI